MLWRWWCLKNADRFRWPSATSCNRYAAHQLQPIRSPEILKKRLEQLLTPQVAHQRLPLAKRLFGDLVPKTVTLLGVTVIWLVLAARPGEVAIVPATLTFHGLPDGMALVRSHPEEVTVRVRSSSGLAPSPRQLDLTADLDLSEVIAGNNTLRLTTAQVRAPSGVSVVGVEPSTVRVTIRSTPTKK